MSDLNWCTYCDNAITITSNNLYCSENCLDLDALHRHPSLGYEFSEFQYFAKSNSNDKLQQNNETSTTLSYQSTNSQNLKNTTLLNLFIQSSAHKIGRTSNMTYKMPSYHKN